MKIRCSWIIENDPNQEGNAGIRQACSLRIRVQGQCVILASKGQDPERSSHRLRGPKPVL